MLLRVTGWLLLIETAYMLIPLLCCLYYNESDWMAFAVSAGVTGLTGFGLTRYVRPRQTHMGRREGVLLTALIWVVFSLFGMLPFIIGSPPVSATDAFFEAMSDFTTTGATTFHFHIKLSHGIELWRAVMQWLGGMGIILFTLAVLPMLNSSGGMQMMNAEVTGFTSDKLSPRVSQTAKRLWFIYISLTLITFILLCMGPMSVFDSLCYAIGALSTGGFSTHSGSIDMWNSLYVKIVLTFGMFLGAVNFSLVYRVIEGKWRTVRNNEVFRVYVCMIAVMMVLYVLTIVTSGKPWTWQSVTVDPLLTIVSVSSTTGFYVFDCDYWGVILVPLTLMMMFTGACVGSTSGGAKLDRVIILIKNCRNEVLRCVKPNAIRPVRINKGVVSPDTVSKVVIFLWIYLLTTIVGGCLLCAMGLNLTDAFVSAFSSMSNSVLAPGLDGYCDNYATMPDGAKWLLTLLMLIGRLEIFTMLLLFSPTFWRK